MDEQCLGDIIGLVYETAVEPDLWPTVMERLADLIGGHSATFIRQNQVTGDAEGLVVRLDPTSTELYRAHFRLLNPFIRRVDAANVAERAFAPVIVDEDRVPKAEMIRTEYYNDFLRPLDVHGFASINLPVIGVDDISISINRSRRQPAFAAEELRLAAAIQPHLARAFLLGDRWRAEEVSRPISRA